MEPTILIISDDPAFRLEIKFALQKENYKIYHYEYNKDVLAFADTYPGINAVIFDFSKYTQEIFAFIILINKFLSNNNDTIIKIICTDFTKTKNNYIEKLPFKVEYINSSQKNFSKSIMYILDALPKNYRINKRNEPKKFNKYLKWAVSSLPEYKKVEDKKTQIELHITKDGIEKLYIDFDKPVSLKKCKDLIEILPVAYLENKFHGTIIEKAKILGINRMKYTRLVENLNKNMIEEFNSAITNF